MTTQDKHTPGPWNAFFARKRNGASCWIIDAMCGTFIAETSEGMPDQHDTEAANARLIAAAPEMLAALVACMEIMRQSEPWDRAKAAEHYEIARAAIARAEGSK